MKTGDGGVKEINMTSIYNAPGIELRTVSVIPGLEFGNLTSGIAHLALQRGSLSTLTIHGNLQDNNDVTDDVIYDVMMKYYVWNTSPTFTYILINLLACVRTRQKDPIKYNMSPFSTSISLMYKKTHLILFCHCSDQQKDLRNIIIKSYHSHVLNGNKLF